MDVLVDGSVAWSQKIQAGTGYFVADDGILSFLHSQLLDFMYLVPFMYIYVSNSLFSPKPLIRHRQTDFFWQYLRALRNKYDFKRHDG